MIYTILKKISVFSGASLVGVLLLPAIVFGQEAYNSSEPLMILGETTHEAGYKGGTNLLVPYIGTIIQYIIATLGIIIFILIIYAGFRWMTAQGNSEQIDEAKAWLRNGVIGLVLVMMAYGIALFIVNRLGGAAGIISSGQ